MTSNTRIQTELRSAFSKAWDKQVIDSEIEPNLSLIAAYIDGRLDKEETDDLAHHLIESPAAWEILEQMLPEGMPIPMPRAANNGSDHRTESTTIPVSHHTNNQQRSESSRRSWVLAVAAGWIVVAVCGGIIWRMQREASDLRGRLANATDAQAQLDELEAQQQVRARQLARLELTELAQQAAPYRPVYLIGDADLGLVRVAMRADHTRSGEPASAATEKNIQATLDRVRDLVKEATMPDRSDQNISERLTEVGALILAGELSQADVILTELEAAIPDPDPPALRSARAIWQAVSARGMSGEDRLLKAAESTLSQLARDGEPQARLNLALLYRELDRAPEANDAAEKYLESNPDPAVAELVRQSFALP